ncbi:MAG: glycosyltransferase family 2 protein [Victivallaceae bacterium]|nr:glycosyltransferase family 2 protein [Victivallaceae bacterium]
MSDKIKTISIASSCCNEEENIREWYARILKVFEKFPRYTYEIVIADNCSKDGTRAILREIASKDKNFKVIFNSNNFGHIRSPYNAFIETAGDAAISMCSDLQEPPEVIEDLIKKWEEGFTVVVATKKQSKCNFLTHSLRKIYYWLLAKISDSDEIIRNFTGFGLYDRKFRDAIKLYKDSYPYFRGLVGEIGFKRAEIKFFQEKRKHGRTKNNFFSLYDMAMTGFVNHSKLPLRLAVFIGFCLAGLSLLAALGYLIYKLLYWDTFTLGLAPLVIGLFFFSAIQLIFIGIIGEYIGAIYTQVKNKPLVVIDEKINFDT